jgi:hypothetical protein
LLVVKINVIERNVDSYEVVSVSVTGERDHELATNAYLATFETVISVTVVFSGVSYDIHTVIITMGSAPTERG